MQVLLTGADGFTGRYVIDALKNDGHTITEFGADLTDLSATRSVVEAARPDAVIHLAAIAHVGHGAVEDFYTVNLLGTRNLLQALSELSETPRISVLASSANIYGNARGGMLDEQVPLAPANDYAVSKLAMEHVASLFRDRLPMTIVRPFNYTGRGQSPNFLVPKIVQHFRDRAPTIELGNLDVSRDFGDVRDVASVYRLLLNETAVGQTLNICTGRSISLQQIIDICRLKTGHDIDVRVNPAFVRENEIRELSGDPSALKRAIPDHAPRPFAETLDWMLGQT